MIPKIIYLAHLAPCNEMFGRRWHRLGISVKGNTVTTIADCNNKRHVNRPMQRDSNQDTISTSGIILLGQLIDDNTFFNVSKVYSAFDVHINTLTLLYVLYREICNN